jgi:two-component system copper resistance phosphate regulon response regulator CusR
MRVLVAESDRALGTYLERSFGAENYAVDLAASADQAKTLVQAHEYDAAILDLNLPREEELGVLRHVRAKRQRLPILALTNRTRPEDRAQVLDLGADDIVEKPFAFSELSARVRALLRRGRHSADTLLRVDDLELSRVEHTVKRGGRKINLTPKEFALLEYLMRNAGVRVTRAQIIENVWNLSFDTMTNVVDVYINYLRKKVDSLPERKLIHTVRGVGYQLQTGRWTGGNRA